MTLQHPGKTSIIATLRRYFKVPSLEKHALEIVQQCNDCIRNKPPIKQSFKTSGFIYSSEPHSKVCADILGPMKLKTNRTEAEKKVSFLVITDVASRWTEVGPLFNTSTAAVIKQFKRLWLKKFQAPEELITDQGVQFTSSDFQDFCAEHSIRQRPTSSYNPTGNSPIERKNQEISTILRLNRELPLNEILKLINLRINYTASTALNISPFEYLSNYSVLDPLRRDLNETVRLASKKDLCQKEERETKSNEGKQKANEETASHAFIKLHDSNKLSPKRKGPFRIILVSPDGNQVTVREYGRLTRHNVKNVVFSRRGESEVVCDYIELFKKDLNNT